MVFEHDLFCNIWKDGIYLFQQIYFFFGQKIKDGFYQKMRGNMVFSVLYMRRRYKHDIAPPPAEKQRCPWPEKVHLRVTSPASPKKMTFILENKAFCWNTTLIDTVERAQESATGDVLLEKVFLEILQNSQEKTCARASFLIKLQA